ncbi:helix-turn-helix transcriptional regulator [Gloeomargarita lithophora]
MSSVLRRCEVLKRLGISKSTLQRWVEAGHFPRPMQIGPRAVAWPESDLTVFLANRQRTGGVE